MRGIGKAFERTFKVYKNIIPFTVVFGIFVLASLLLLPWVSSYVNAGAGFIRFSSLIYDVTIPQLAVFLLAGFTSLLFLAVFISLIMTTIKMLETLDIFGVRKILSIFPTYVSRVLMLLLFLSVFSIGIGIMLDLFSVPKFIVQVILIGIWLPFLFAPQILVLEDFSISRAIEDSFLFLKRSPSSFIAYIFVATLLLAVVTAIETTLSQFMFWESKIISLVLVSMFVLPFLQVLATELYILRYPLQHSAS
jgi:hypothetical protein